MVLELILCDVSGLAGSFLLLSEPNSALIFPLFSDDKIYVRFQKAGITKCSYGFKPSLVIGEFRKRLEKNNLAGAGGRGGRRDSQSVD